jgi:hypothetical protein
MCGVGVLAFLEFVKSAFASPGRAAALLLLLAVILLALDTLLRTITQRFTSGGFACYGLLGPREFRWDSLTGWSGIGQGRRVPVTVRLWSGIRAIDVVPNSFRDSPAVYAFLQEACKNVPQRAPMLSRFITRIRGLRRPGQ